MYCRLKVSSGVTPIVIIILSAFVLTCGPKRETIKPTEESISESVFASGVVKSNNQYEVFSVVSGRIEEIFESEGAFIKKGMPLLRLSNDASRLNLDNARLASTYADLKANTEQLEEARAEADLAKTKVVNDSLLMVRQQNLRSQNVGTQVELEQRQLAYKNSVTLWRAALIRYTELERQLKFKAAQSRKTLEISTSLANDFIVTSDRDGKVYKLYKKMGEMATPQMPLAVIGESDNFLVELQVDENDISEISLGLKVLFSMDSYPDQIFEGTIDKIYPMMDERTKSFPVDASFVKSPSTLYPNLTVEANIIIQTKKKAVTIPRQYLISDSLVMKADGKKYKVVTGLKDYVRVEIVKGLSVDDEIVKPDL